MAPLLCAGERPDLFHEVGADQRVACGEREVRAVRAREPRGRLPAPVPDHRRRRHAARARRRRARQAARAVRAAARARAAHARQVGGARQVERHLD